MRLSRSVMNNLCVLSLVGSVVEQMQSVRTQFGPSLQALHDDLRHAHRYARATVLELADIQTNGDDEMKLEDETERWNRVEKEFFDTVMKTVPEKTLDARMWMTAVLLVVEDYTDTVPQHAQPYRELWDGIASIMAAIYAMYDPGYRCRAKMREGMKRGQSIMEALKGGKG